MFVEDAAPFFNDFAVEARFSIGGSEKVAAVILDKPYASPFDGQIDAAAPECIGPTDALGALQRDDAITIAGTDYRVRSAEPDGTGMTRLVLYTPGV